MTKQGIVYLLGVVLLGLFYEPMKAATGGEMLFLFAAIAYLVLLRLAGAGVASVWPNHTDRSMKFCCEPMQSQINYKCGQHTNPFICPDVLIHYSEKFDEYGLIVHDGGESFCEISFCPWCGGKLPGSKREKWFGELEALGYENPNEQDIPQKYRTGEWYRA